MDDTLRLIQHLYDEDVDHPDFARRLQEDETLRRKYEALQGTKAALDRRSSPSPDPDVVNDIVDYACRETDACQATDAREDAQSAQREETSAPAPDRAAREWDRSRRRRLQGVSTILVVLLVAGVGWWQFRVPESAPAGPTANAPTPQSTDAASTTPRPAAATDNDMPDWDDQDDVVRLHHRIEMLHTQNHSDGWGGGSLQATDRTRP
ncbi:MAG: hypothetical protein BRD55_04155 [Bacteroidetes bacterium SW_9_63_38]|nr:MAG: hypothetical protein BRD55_04155 [Bacteroidetes bacterium SW_9_63_38]